MSAWRLLVKALAARSGEAKCSELVREVGLRIGHAALTARRLGLVEKPERLGRGVPCRLSKLGWAYVRGEAVARLCRQQPGSARRTLAVRMVEAE